MELPFLKCMALVAELYALPPRVLPSIQRIEGGRPGVISQNRNGTEDYGVMQINSLWLPELARYTRTSQATVRDHLTARPCYNIAAAGLIFRTYLDGAGGDLMVAIGNYHSHTPLHHNAYRTKVLGAARFLFQEPVRPALVQRRP